MRRAAKRDTSEKSIIAALKKRNCSITQLSQRGVLDLLVGTPDKRFILMECKTGNGKLEDDQEKFIKIHSGCPMFVVRTPEEAIAALEAA
jgi:hypothetical protein